MLSPTNAVQLKTADLEVRDACYAIADDEDDGVDWDSAEITSV